MYPELPLEWQAELASRFAKVENGGLKVVDPSEMSKTNTLGVLMVPTEETKLNLHKYLKDSLPTELLPKLFIQPWSGYHMSLQWTPESTIDMEDFTTRVGQILGDVPQQSVKIYLTYFTDVNLTAIVTMPGLNLSILRADLNKVFDKSGLTPKLPIINTAWISLVKFTQPLTTSEIQILQNLPKTVFDTQIKKVVIALNDPFFTPQNSEIISKIRLR